LKHDYKCTVIDRVAFKSSFDTLGHFENSLCDYLTFVKKNQQIGLL